MNPRQLAAQPADDEARGAQHSRRRPARTEPVTILREGWSFEATPTRWVTNQSFTGKALARLEGPAGSLCLRRYPRGTAEHWLQAVHRALAFLEGRGFRLFPHQIATASSQPVLRHGAHLYDLSTWVRGEGVVPNALSDEQLANLGAVIARLHLTGAGAPGPPVRFDWLTRRQRLTQQLAWDPVARGSGRAAWQRKGNLDAFYTTLARPDSPAQADRDARAIVAAASEALRWLERAGPAADLTHEPATLTHGDLWSDHIRFCDVGVIALLDFDTLALRPPPGDLAALCADFGGWDAGRCAAILAGYGRLRSVSVESVAALPHLGALRTLGVLSERLHAWLTPGRHAKALASLGGPVPYWRDQLQIIAALDPLSFARRVLRS